jgi:hypothetical protein
MSLAFRESVEILREAQSLTEDRGLLDLAIDLRATDGEKDLGRLYLAGGKWDRRRKRYIGRPTAARRISVHSGQLEAARWFVEWCRRKVRGDWTGFRRVWSALFVGGRRGGKTHLGVVAIVIYAVLVPGAKCWCISPRQEETDELLRLFKSIMPKAWYRYRGDPKWEFRLVNGSTIRLLSGYRSAGLKRGGVDIALYNEGQNMSQEGFIQLRGAVVDSGGLVLVPANPPDEPIGRWVEELWEKARARKVKVEPFQFDPQKNPFIEYESLADMADETDDLTYRRVVLGVFVPIGDVVFHAWRDGWNLIDVPAGFVDITEEFTKQHLGRAFRHIVGADFQRSPHMAATVIKVYRDPADEERTPLLWVVDEIIVENADEDDLIDGLEFPPAGPRCPCCAGQEQEGYAPNDTAVIADASGDWQDADRTRGRGSFDWFRRRGWRFIYQPDSRMKKNPEISERVKVGNALLHARSGKRRLFVARHCEQTARAMKLWERRNGAPHRRSDFAHVCDAVTYPCWRFYPRRRAAPPAEVKIIAKPEGRGRMQGW